MSGTRAPHVRFQALALDARQFELKPEAFLAERHIVVSGSRTGHAAYHIIEKELAGRLAADRIQLRLPSFTAGAMVAKRMDAVLTIPGNLPVVMAREFDLALFRTPVVMAEIELAQLWHERVQNDSAHRWLRATIFSLFRNKRALLKQAAASAFDAGQPGD